MKTKRKQSGITLMEMTVVVAAAALLAVFGLPAIRAFVNSLESKGPTEAMINAALSSARAIAVKEHRYAGIRFQCAYEPNNPKGALAAPQYMIFIVHDFDKTGLANGFRAVEGLQPIKLPDSVGVMDLRIRMSSNEDNSADKPIEVVGDDASSNSNIDDILELSDTTAFSIIFSPSGKLVIHDVRIRNRDGYKDSSSDTRRSYDDVFNKLQEVDNEIGMFYQDDYSGNLNGTNLGLGKEPSRNSFIIYERDKFKAAYEKKLAWSDYLKTLAPIYVNPYTGTIIRQD